MSDCPENVIVVRRKSDGSLDEIVAGDAIGDGLFIHLEQMSATSWWLGIYHKGYRQAVWLRSKSAIAASSEMDAAPPEDVIEVRRNPDGSLDEIVAGDARGDGLFIHLEQMSATSWWLSIYHKGYRQTVWFRSKSAIAANSEMDTAPHPTDEASDDRS